MFDVSVCVLSVLVIRVRLICRFRLWWKLVVW